MTCALGHRARTRTARGSATFNLMEHVSSIGRPSFYGFLARLTVAMDADVMAGRLTLTSVCAPVAYALRLSFIIP